MKRLLSSVLLGLMAAWPSVAGALSTIEELGSLNVRAGYGLPKTIETYNGDSTTGMLALVLTAGCGDSVEVRDLTIVYTGTGDFQNVVNVYAASGDAISTIKKFTAQDLTAAVSFNPPLTIEKCQSLPLTVIGEISDRTIGATYSVMIEQPADIVTDAGEVTGAFPFRGSTVIIPKKQTQGDCVRAARKLSGSKRLSAMRSCRGL